jgi:hypothetical protein
MHRIAGRPSSSLSRRICVLVLLLLLPVLLCCARERESKISVREMRRTMMNSSSSPPLTSAAAAARAKALGSTASRAASVPGLPDLPDADAPLQSVQEDAAAAIRALRSAVDYGGRKKVPSREPVWRRGLPSHGGTGAAAEAAAASVATTAAATARADGGRRGSTAIPAGIVVEEYEVLSEERERVVGGQRSRERLWVRRGWGESWTRFLKFFSPSNFFFFCSCSRSPIFFFLRLDSFHSLSPTLGAPDRRAAGSEHQRRSVSFSFFLVPRALPAALDRRLQGQDEGEAAAGRGARVRGAGPGVPLLRDTGPPVGALLPRGGHGEGGRRLPGRQSRSAGGRRQ